MGEERNIGSDPRPNSVCLGNGKRSVCYGICSYDSNAMKSSNPFSGFYITQTSRTLDFNGGNPACNQGGVPVIQYGNEYEQPTQM